MKTVKTVKTVKAVIGQWHDYIAMNFHECILDPTPEESDRILRESVIELENVETI